MKIEIIKRGDYKIIPENKAEEIYLEEEIMDGGSLNSEYEYEGNIVNKENKMLYVILTKNKIN